MILLKHVLFGYCILSLLSCNSVNKPQVKQTDVILQQSPGEKITDQIMYESHIVSHDGDDMDWYENIPSSPRIDFLNKIFTLINNGKLTAYKSSFGQPTNDKTDELTPKEVKNLLITQDSLGGKLIEKPLNKKYLSQITFAEEWSFDEKNIKFYKKVKGMAFSKEVYSTDSIFKGYQRLFWVWFEPVKLNIEL